MNVLIIKDKNHNLDALEKELLFAGYKVYFINDLENALDFCLSNFVNTVIYECEIKNNDKNKIAKELRKLSYCKIKVVVLTGSGLDSDDKNIQNNYVYKYFKKPFDLKLLLSCLETIDYEYKAGKRDYYKNVNFS